MMDQSLRQLPTLLNLAKEFNANMQVGYVAAFIPGIATIGGVFLLKLGIFASAMIYNIGLFAGVGIAMLPLLLRQQRLSELAEKTTESSDKNLGQPEQ